MRAFNWLETRVPDGARGAAQRCRAGGYRAILLQHDAPRYWPLLGEHLPCQRVMTCNNITFAREATLAGAGICGLPVMISEGRCAAGVWSSCCPRRVCRWGGVAIYPSRRFQAMKAKTFLDFLIASLPITRGGLLEPGAVGLLTSPA